MKGKIQINLSLTLKAEDGAQKVLRRKQFKVAIKGVLYTWEVQKIQQKVLLYRRVCFRTIQKIVLLNIVKHPSNIVTGLVTKGADSNLSNTKGPNYIFEEII